jgi:hypothetical protein
MIGRNEAEASVAETLLPVNEAIIAAIKGIANEAISIGSL